MSYSIGEVVTRSCGCQVIVTDVEHGSPSSLQGGGYSVTWTKIYVCNDCEGDAFRAQVGDKGRFS